MTKSSTYIKLWESKIYIMTHIGIVCPLWSEAKSILNWHPDPYIYKYKKRSWIELSWNGCQIVVVVSKIGRANATKATLALIQKFAPQLVVNYGSAGAIDPAISIGKSVVSTATAEYGEDTSKLYPILPNLVSLANSIKEITTGPIVSADQNIDSNNLKQKLFSSYQAVCGDWESAVVVRVCRELHVPALAFRVITDLGNADMYSDFKKHHEQVLLEASSLLQRYLMGWSNMK